MLDILVSLFHWTWLLQMWFTLPVLDKKVMHDILDSLPNLNLSTIGNECIHCSPFSDVILESSNKLLISVDTIDIHYQRFSTNKELSLGCP